MGWDGRAADGWVWSQPTGQRAAGSKSRVVQLMSRQRARARLAWLQLAGREAEREREAEGKERGGDGDVATQTPDYYCHCRPRLDLDLHPGAAGRHEPWPWPRAALPLALATGQAADRQSDCVAPHPPSHCLSAGSWLSGGRSDGCMTRYLLLLPPLLPLQPPLPQPLHSSPSLTIQTTPLSLSRSPS